MSVEDLHQPRTGVLGHGHSVAEGETRGSDPVVAEPPQPLVHPLQAPTRHRRQVEIGRESLGAPAGLLQGADRGRIAGIGAGPEAFGRLGAERVIDLLGRRLDAARIGAGQSLLHLPPPGLLQAAPDAVERRPRENRRAQSIARGAAERHERAEDGVAGAAVERLGGDHAVDHPHGGVAFGARGQGGLEVADGAVGRRGQQGPHRGELTLGQLAHNNAVTPEYRPQCC